MDYRPHPGAQSDLFYGRMKLHYRDPGFKMGGTGAGSKFDRARIEAHIRHSKELMKKMGNDHGPEDNVGRRKYYPGDLRAEISRIRKNVNRDRDVSDKVVGMLNRGLSSLEMTLETMEDDHPEAFMKIEIERRSHLPKTPTQLMDEEQQRLEELEHVPVPPPNPPHLSGAALDEDRNRRYPLIWAVEPLVFDHPVGSWQDLTKEDKDRFFKHYGIPDWRKSGRSDDDETGHGSQG